MEKRRFVDNNDQQANVTARRAARQARREKQRQQNVLRAEKMHAVRMAADLAFPPPAAPPPEGMDIHVGCSGWFYWHWRNCFYPEGSSSSEWFRHYASRFKTVELNAPFYSWPTVATVQGWLRQAGRRKFIYTVKVCELITHTRRFAGTKRLIGDFSFIADLLGPRMGCFLFQLPPSFYYTPTRLRVILSQLELKRRNVIEFRHKSWWNETVYSAFRQAGVIFCTCSAPRLPDELIKTADDIYIRFHGRKQWYRHNYSEDELQQWAERIRQSGARRVWIYFNNDRECYAIQNARELLRRLKKLK